MGTQGVTVVVQCTDMRRSERFYRDVLGAIPLPSETVPWLRIGATRITLIPNTDHRAPRPMLDHAMVWLWIDVADLGEMHQRCLAHGVTVVDPPDGATMTIADPDGLRIEIWQG